MPSNKVCSKIAEAKWIFIYPNFYHFGFFWGGGLGGEKGKLGGTKKGGEEEFIKAKNLIIFCLSLLLVCEQNTCQSLKLTRSWSKQAGLRG